MNTPSIASGHVLHWRERINERWQESVQAIIDVGCWEVLGLRDERDRRSFDTAPLFSPCTARELEVLIARGMKFGTVYADPPWLYENQGTRAATSNHYVSPTRLVRRVACHETKVIIYLALSVIATMIIQAVNLPTICYIFQYSLSH